MGLYLEIECSSWANQSTTIGDGRPLDRFIWDESERIVNTFGNHPSFCMMMYGNEPAGVGSSTYLTNFVTTWKDRDNRRLYCSGAGWPMLAVNDFLSDPAPRIQGWGQGLRSIINAEPPRTDYDWSEYVSRFSQPVVSHEIGQWCVYPNFKEISKYDGVMRPANMEIFRDILQNNGMIHLQTVSCLRPANYRHSAIKQMLRLLYVPGISVDSSYWDSMTFRDKVQHWLVCWMLSGKKKGYISPEEYRRFCAPTVPLVRLPKLIYKNDELLNARVEVAHYGETPLKNVAAGWTLSDTAGNVLQSGQWKVDLLPIGNNFPLGDISASLAQMETPRRLVLEVAVGEWKNSWNVWVYPALPLKIEGEESIRMVDCLDATTLKALEGGASVLLSLKKGTLTRQMGGDIQVGFSSIFWNTAWTGGQAPHTLGILCNPKHPALSQFPTEYYSDYQWWDAISHSGAIKVAELSPEIAPIVRVIDDWFTNRPLALLFEVKVGNGKLLVSGVDFWQNMDKRVQARQLLYSLKKYMASPAFSPVVSVQAEQVQQLVSDK